MSGEGASSVMSQLAPTSCIIVPTLETTEAIQRKRKSSCARVAQGDIPRADWPAGAEIAGLVGSDGFSVSVRDSPILFLEYNKMLARRDRGEKKSAIDLKFLCF
jgi:hypothetical protein